MNIICNLFWLQIWIWILFVRNIHKYIRIFEYSLHSGYQRNPTHLVFFVYKFHTLSCQFRRNRLNTEEPWKFVIKISVKRKVGLWIHSGNSLFLTNVSKLLKYGFCLKICSYNISKKPLFYWSRFLKNSEIFYII